MTVAGMLSRGCLDDGARSVVVVGRSAVGRERYSLGRGMPLVALRTDMVLDALPMASWSRGTRLDGLVTH